MMVAPMVVLMILTMRHMFPSRPANIAIIAFSIIAFAGSFALIRTQTTIGDRAFLRSMIPHHSGAILMCREANISDPQVKRLCGEIIESQRDRKSVVQGRSVSVRVDLGGRRNIKKNNLRKRSTQYHYINK